MIALALSFRQAARMLGIDRGATLHELIDVGLLQPVPWGKGKRIPLEQVQQLARTGFTIGGKPSRHASRPRRPPPPGRIRDIEVAP